MYELNRIGVFLIILNGHYQNSKGPTPFNFDNDATYIFIRE